MSPNFAETLTMTDDVAALAPKSLPVTTFAEAPSCQESPLFGQDPLLCSASPIQEVPSFISDIVTITSDTNVPFGICSPYVSPLASSSTDSLADFYSQKYDESPNGDALAQLLNEQENEHIDIDGTCSPILDLDSFNIVTPEVFGIPRPPSPTPPTKRNKKALTVNLDTMPRSANPRSPVRTPRAKSSVTLVKESIVRVANRVGKSSPTASRKVKASKARGGDVKHPLMPNPALCESCTFLRAIREGTRRWNNGKGVMSKWTDPELYGIRRGKCDHQGEFSPADSQRARKGCKQSETILIEEYGLIYCPNSHAWEHPLLHGLKGRSHCHRYHPQWEVIGEKCKNSTKCPGHYLPQAA